VEITGLRIYPVKSMKGIEIRQATLTPEGLLHDRHFMMIRAGGRFVTQRDMPPLSLITVDLEESGISLSMEGAARIAVPFGMADGKRFTTKVWNDSCETVDQGEEISNWLTESLQSSERLHLVAMQPGYTRPQGKADVLGADTHTLFADAAPLLVANEASLQALNSELVARGHQAVPMDRFRPNIILRGLDAFREHGVAGMSANGIDLRFHHPCQRCIVTTIDQGTARKNPQKEPFCTLCDINPMPGSKRQPAFGQNASLESGNGLTIAVGNTFATRKNTP
jgi:uncharacterized protein YcbX